MLPVGALVVVLFRNVVGMPTFGTFLPALIAAAAGETGGPFGVVAVLIVVAVVAAVRVGAAGGSSCSTRRRWPSCSRRWS